MCLTLSTSHYPHLVQIFVLPLSCPVSSPTPFQVTILSATFSADEHPQYEAPSYTWGNLSNPVSISILHHDGHFSSFGIGQNLWSALVRLRWPNKARIIWTDAIYINQDDIEEMSWQMAKMGQIYGNASKVIVWLGGASSNSAKAFEVLQHLGRQVEFTSKSLSVTQALNADVDYRD